MKQELYLHALQLIPPVQRKYVQPCPKMQQLCDSSDRILPTYSHPIQLLDQTDSSLSTAGSVLPQSLNNQLHGRFWHKVTFNTKVMLPFVGDDCAPQIPYSSTNI